MPKKKKKVHVISVGLKKGQLTLGRHHVVAAAGDTIAWVLTKKRIASFAVTIPSFVSPLGWRCRAKKGNMIKGTVRANAVPGIYPYAVCMCAGPKLLIIDPDIIVPPPKGGKGA